MQHENEKGRKKYEKKKKCWIKMLHSQNNIAHISSFLSLMFFQ